MADAQALILAAGQGSRMGQGPKAFLRLRGETLLERAVRVMRDVVDDVIVAVPAEDLERARSLVAGPTVRVIPGGASRSASQRLLVEAADAPWMVLHDVVHPTVSAMEAQQVLAVARQSGAACPVVPIVDFQYRADGSLLAAPGEALTIQKPVCFRRDEFLWAWRLVDEGTIPAPAREPSIIEVLALVGRQATFVPAMARAPKLTTAEDLALLRGGIAPEPAYPAETGDEPIQLVPIVGRERQMTTWSFDPRYGSGDAPPLEAMIRRLISLSDITTVDVVVGIPEGGTVPAFAFATAAAKRLVLATIWQADAPGVIRFQEEHDMPAVRTKYLHGLTAGTKVIIVEDEVTTGQTVLNCVRALRAAGVVVDTVATMFASPDPEVRRRLAAAGVAIHAASWADRPDVGDVPARG